MANETTRPKRYELTPETIEQGRTRRSFLVGGNPLEYMNVFEQAYRNLGQPETEAKNQSPGLTLNATRSLADNFINRIYEKTGQFPDEAQVKDFLSNTLTPRYAEHVITGINDEQIKTQYVDPYMQVNPEEFPKVAEPGAVPAEDAITAGLRERMDEILGRVQEGGVQSIRKQFGPIRERLAAEEATLGSRLRSPISSIPREKLAAEESGAVSNLITDIMGKRASGELDLSKTIASIQESERRAKESGRQFLQGLSLKRDIFGEEQKQFDIQRDLFGKKMNLAKQLGEQQAESMKPGTLDYINTALRGLESIAKLKQAFG